VELKLEIVRNLLLEGQIPKPRKEMMESIKKLKIKRMIKRKREDVADFIDI